MNCYLRRAAPRGERGGGRGLDYCTAEPNFGLQIRCISSLKIAHIYASLSGKWKKGEMYGERREKTPTPVPLLQPGHSV